jgi:isopentenyl-diphosphate Delta-isomerase
MNLIAQHPITIPAIAADGRLYPMEKLEAHRHGALHLAISVFVLSHDGRLLIQQRALDKYHCGGLWANTCCSHPHWGEPIQTAAERRMDEELGACPPLRPVAIVQYHADVGGGLIEHERVHMFVGKVEPDDLLLRPDPAEVAAIRWISQHDLQAELSAAPQHFAPWFALYIQRWMALWAPTA